MANILASRPNNAPKLISKMTADQAELKRASDRVHQRYSRAREKGQIYELETRNAALIAQLAGTEKKLKELQESHTSLCNAINAIHGLANPLCYSPVASKLPQSPHGLDNESQLSGSFPIQTSSSSLADLYLPPSPLVDCGTIEPAISNNFVFDRPIGFVTGLVVSMFNNSSLGRTTTFNILPDVCEPWLVCNQQVHTSGELWLNPHGTSVQGIPALKRQGEGKLSQIDEGDGTFFGILIARCDC
jgi:hypothetical protein